MPSSPATAPPVLQGDWRSRSAACAEQEPLIDTHLSLRGLREAESHPRTIFVGVGLCSPDTLSRAVPLDLLGLILPAETVRQACGAEELLVVIADQHAIATGHDLRRVQERAREVEETLAHLRLTCGLDALNVVRASSYVASSAYQTLLRDVRHVSASRSDYVHRQLADVFYFQRERGSLLKVGWALQEQELERRSDEVAFDQALCAAGGRDLGFVYCRPGRALSDRTPRVAPYVVRRPDQRLLIDEAEDARSKLARASEELSRDSLRAFCRHLKLLLYTYGRVVEPIRGALLSERANALLDKLAP